MRLARQWIQDRIGSKNTENDLKQFNMMAEIHTFMHETKGMDMRQKLKLGKKVMMEKMEAKGVSVVR